uniref:Metalloendopeptidase n=1 Tax=Hofstenia miamia TaxID=442651 RepID=A0A068CNI0_HOFMI|nr:tolloid [Hofstenia miamia]
MNKIIFCLAVYTFAVTAAEESAFIETEDGERVELVHDPCASRSYESDIALNDQEYNYLKTLSETSRKRKKPGRKKRAATSLKERVWENGIIPYVIEGNFSGVQRALFHKAMRHWENYTCITFVKRTNEVDFIAFTYRNCGCCSFVGRKGEGSQAISIAKNCDKFGVVIHELGHAVGFWHEHTRPDRDQYITVLKENIMDSQGYNFDKLESKLINSLGEEYDYGSIMHYAPNTFSKGGYLPTIRTREDPITGKRPEIGQRNSLSEGDIRQTMKLYKCPICGESLLSMTGEITSPNYPNFYGANRYCEWRISISPGEKISLNFTEFQIRENHNCEKEYVEVYDGTAHTGQYLGRWCGNKKPENILSSSGSRMWIRFVSDNINGRRGKFRAVYISICGGTITSRTAQIQSPQFPENYPNLKTCVWKIYAQPGYKVGLKFRNFELEKHSSCIYDYVEISEDEYSQPSTKVCGIDTPDPVSSSGSVLYVKFVSDKSVSKPGFSAEIFPEEDECNQPGPQPNPCSQECENTVGSYRCICHAGYELDKDKTTCKPACGGNIVELKGEIMSPKYPDLYPLNKHCVWKISAPEAYQITINILDIELEGKDACKYDYLQINSSDNEQLALYCGTTLPSKSITSENNIIKIIFHSDSSVPKHGFKLRFFSDYDECKINNGGCQQICKNTPVSRNCSCQPGYTLHQDGKSCKETECKYTFTAASGEFATPNYPKEYPMQKECTWHIITKPGHRVALRFITFAVEPHAECQYDYLEIRCGSPRVNRLDTTLCGNRNPSDIGEITSDGNEMFLVFRSDTSVNKPGFKVEYTSKCGGRLNASSQMHFLYSHAEYGDGYYASGLLCVWRITAPIGKKVRYRNNFFLIEDEGNCKFDSVTIRSQFDTKSKDSSLAVLCGKPIHNRNITSPTRFMEVVFETDSSVNDKGFNATYWAV